jgi:hypothetical protein
MQLGRDSQFSSNLWSSVACVLSVAASSAACRGDSVSGAGFDRVPTHSCLFSSPVHGLIGTDGRLASRLFSGVSAPAGPGRTGIEGRLALTGCPLERNGSRETLG